MQRTGSSWGKDRFLLIQDVLECSLDHVFLGYDPSLAESSGIASRFRHDPCFSPDDLQGQKPKF
jgi:hypothetical protein